VTLQDHAQFHDIGFNPALSWVTVLGQRIESMPPA
jgi:hypothetical protein